MTVKELKEKLENINENAEIYVANFAVGCDCEFMISEALDIDNDLSDMAVIHFYEDSYLRDECKYEEEDKDLGICKN